MAAQYKTLDGDTDGARPDTCLKESRGNGKCGRKHPLIDRHTKKKKKKKKIYSIPTHIRYITEILLQN